ncbi:ankyrin repeat domain-containing protein [Sneathiella marina]|uniref:Ankyrin repeat domain-containing protein n=1 Tax=Sneathiella marina TaxID=2950108 RepID=A0ABY4W632_9PROT|nr:ankyrin repeat domain-containing protein [Sneathiella marina]USG61367.1 ankyrin repeat domain-containing protein [Sneathiella marina]
MKLYLCIFTLLLLAATSASAQSIFGGDEVFTEAARDNAQAVEEYLLTGNNVNARNTRKVPLLVAAATAGAVKSVKILIKHKAQIDLADNLGNTALMQAAAYGSVDVLNILLENKAKIDAENRQGETALIKAAQAGHLDAVQLLLDNQANIEISDFTGRTALDYADQNRHRAVAKRLRETP